MRHGATVFNRGRRGAAGQHAAGRQLAVSRLCAGRDRGGLARLRISYRPVRRSCDAAHALRAPIQRNARHARRLPPDTRVLPRVGRFPVCGRCRRCGSSADRVMTRATPSIPSEFAALTCSAPEERAARMAELVLRHAPAGPIRLLDLGCGTGRLLFRLSSALPSATCVGIDISLANIGVAEAARRLCPERDRLAFEVVDYLKWKTPPMDLIATDSVLNLIDGDTDSLVAK